MNGTSAGQGSNDRTSEKIALRAAMRKAIASISTEQRSLASHRIAARLEQSEVFAKARTILLFVPLPSEPDLRELLKRTIAIGNTVLLPRARRDPPAIEVAAVDPALSLDDQLAPDDLGVLAPTGPAIDPASVELAIVPGVAFSADGARLGRGGGYYDRLLAALPSATRTIGVCFHLQRLEAIPEDAHDRRVQAVITDAKSPA